LYIFVKAALNLWSIITSLLICDDHILEDCNPYINEVLFKSENDLKKKLNDWIQENNTNISLVTSQMIKTREHQHWRVRYQLVSSCDILLHKCTRYENLQLIFLYLHYRYDFQI